MKLREIIPSILVVFVFLAAPAFAQPKEDKLMLHQRKCI